MEKRFPLTNIHKTVLLCLKGNVLGPGVGPTEKPLRDERKKKKTTEANLAQLKPSSTIHPD